MAGSKAPPSSSAQVPQRTHQSSSSSSSKVPALPAPTSTHAEMAGHSSSSTVASENIPPNGSHSRSGNGDSASSIDHQSKESSHLTHGQLHGNARSSSSASVTSGSIVPMSRSHHGQHHPQAQHRSHPSGGYPGAERSSLSSQPSSSSQSASSGSMPTSRSGSQPSRHSASLPPNARPQSGSSSGHPMASRPRHDPKRPEGTHRPDVADMRRSLRPVHPQLEDVSRSSTTVRPMEHPHRPVEQTTHTPPPKVTVATASPAIKPPTPPTSIAEMATENITAQSDSSLMLEGSTPQSLDPNKMRAGSASCSKLSLSSYRERVKSRPAPPSSGESTTDDSGLGITPGVSEDTPNTQTPTKDMPSKSAPPIMSLKPSASAPELTNFNVAQNSPNPLKIKVKREPSSGERHSVKYADTGLKIKIKPPRMEPSEEAGPSGSRSGTPMEEGEVIDSPSSVSSGDRKSEGGLKIRIPMPRPGEGAKSSEQINGFGDHGRPHHHSHHHRSHHSHKSKKHSSKHSSRHERSSKRPSSHDHEERPSKSSRQDYQSTSNPVDMIRSYSESRHDILSRTLQHQNSGFSINDAFSSSLPNTIFDEDEDSSQIPPPVTPTDAFNHPPHHEKFHLLMSKHRAQIQDKPPLPPLPSNSCPPPPPPPPPASTPPPPPSL